MTRGPRALHPVLLYLATMVVLSAAAPLLGVPVGRVSEVAIYALYATAVNLLLGYTGLVSFGASLFFGVGTYAAALFALRVAGNEAGALLAAAIVAGLLGALVGAVVLRRRGLYFSLLTLAFSQLAFEIAFKWSSVTGGENGLQSVPASLFPGAWSFHAFAVLSVAALLALLWGVVNSPVGRVLQAIRDNEQRARCIGYDTYRYKLFSFAFSSALTGYAGGLLAFLIRGAYANNLAWDHAADALLMVVLGGASHFLGPLWGAVAFIVLEDQLSLLTEHWWLIFAPIIIGFVLLSPDGIQGAVQRATGRRHATLVRREQPMPPATIPPYRSAGHGTPSGPILSVRGLSKRFGALVTASGISLDVSATGLHSFIGPNGAGKTTFFNMLSGLVLPDAGAIVFHGRDITRMPPHRRVRLGLARSFQIISLFPNLTAFESIRLAVQAMTPGRLRLLGRSRDHGAIDLQTWSILAAVQLQDRAGTLCTMLSHGELRLLDLALVLASSGDLLLLDEPLAGLSAADREVVATVVLGLSRTAAVLMVEHDMDRVMALSDRVTVLHGGRLIADGPPAEVARDPLVIAAYVGEAMPDTPPARPFAPDAPPREPLLTLESVTAGYASSTVLQDVDLKVHRNEVVALLGRNGAGKTTTLRAIAGALPLRAGRILFDGQDITGRPTYAINRLGVGLVPEGRRLFPNLTVRENLQIAMRPGGGSLEDAFTHFPKLRTLQASKAANLSGGERQMLAIARVLMFPTSLILLDEPFEGLAPAIVKEVMQAVLRLKDRASVVIVEHKAEFVLPFADRAYVLNNGRVGYAGTAAALLDDELLRARLLGVTHGADAGAPVADPGVPQPALPGEFMR